MENLSRNNHYVPQFYLDNWGKNKNIWKYQLLVSNERVPLWSHVSIKHTASIENLYVRIEKNEEIDDFEKMFDIKFESTGKIAMDKAVNGERLSMSDWDKLIDFITAQIVRTPAFFQRLRPIIQQSLKESLTESVDKLKKIKEKPPIMVDKIKSDKLIPISFIDLGESEKEGFEDIKIEVIEGKSTWLWSIQHLLEKSKEVMHQHKWSIITCDGTLPTSDDPVVCFKYYGGHKYEFGGGWQQDGTQIVCPISPHKVLYTQVGGKAPSRMNFDKKHSELLKELIINHAFREIYAVEQDENIPLIRKREVNLEKYNEDIQMIDKWYSKYIDTEGKKL